MIRIRTDQGEDFQCLHKNGSILQPNRICFPLKSFKIERLMEMNCFLIGIKIISTIRQRKISLYGFKNIKIDGLQVRKIKDLTCLTQRMNSGPFLVKSQSSSPIIGNIFFRFENPRRISKISLKNMKKHEVKEFQIFLNENLICQESFEEGKEEISVDLEHINITREYFRNDLNVNFE